MCCVSLLNHNTNRRRHGVRLRKEIEINKENLDNISCACCVFRNHFVVKKKIQNPKKCEEEKKKQQPTNKKRKLICQLIWGVFLLDTIHKFSHTCVESKWSISNEKVVNEMRCDKQFNLWKKKQNLTKFSVILNLIFFHKM